MDTGTNAPADDAGSGCPGQGQALDDAPRLSPYAPLHRLPNLSATLPFQGAAAVLRDDFTADWTEDRYIIRTVPETSPSQPSACNYCMAKGLEACDFIHPCLGHENTEPRELAGPTWTLPMPELDLMGDPHPPTEDDKLYGRSEEDYQPTLGGDQRRASLTERSQSSFSRRPTVWTAVNGNSNDARPINHEGEPHSQDRGASGNDNPGGDGGYGRGSDDGKHNDDDGGEDDEMDEENEEDADDHSESTWEGSSSATPTAAATQYGYIAPASAVYPAPASRVRWNEPAQIQARKSPPGRDWCSQCSKHKPIEEFRRGRRPPGKGQVFFNSCEACRRRNLDFKKRGGGGGGGGGLGRSGGGVGGAIAA